MPDVTSQRMYLMLFIMLVAVYKFEIEKYILAWPVTSTPTKYCATSPQSDSSSGSNISKTCTGLKGLVQYHSRLSRSAGVKANQTHVQTSLMPAHPDLPNPGER